MLSLKKLVQLFHELRVHVLFRGCRFLAIIFRQNATRSQLIFSRLVLVVLIGAVFHSLIFTIDIRTGGRIVINDNKFFEIVIGEDTDANLTMCMTLLAIFYASTWYFTYYQLPFDRHIADIHFELSLGNAQDIVAANRKIFSVIFDLKTAWRYPKDYVRYAWRVLTIFTFFDRFRAANKRYVRFGRPLKGDLRCLARPIRCRLMLLMLLWELIQLGMILVSITLVPLVTLAFFWRPTLHLLLYDSYLECAKFFGQAALLAFYTYQIFQMVLNLGQLIGPTLYAIWAHYVHLNRICRRLATSGHNHRRVPPGRLSRALVFVHREHHLLTLAMCRLSDSWSPHFMLNVLGSLPFSSYGLAFLFFHRWHRYFIAMLIVLYIAYIFAEIMITIIPLAWINRVAHQSQRYFPNIQDRLGAGNIVLKWRYLRFFEAINSRAPIGFRAGCFGVIRFEAFFQVR